MAVPFPKCEGIQGEFYLTVDDKLHEHVAPLSDDLPLSVYTQSYRHAAREHTKAAPDNSIYRELTAKQIVEIKEKVRALL